MKPCCFDPRLHAAYIEKILPASPTPIWWTGLTGRSPAAAQAGGGDRLVKPLLRHPGVRPAERSPAGRASPPHSHYRNERRSQAGGAAGYVGGNLNRHEPLARVTGLDDSDVGTHHRRPLTTT